MLVGIRAHERSGRSFIVPDKSPLAEQAASEPLDLGR